MSAVLGTVLGATTAGGLLLAASGTPRARRITLDDRLAPYLRDAPRPSRLLARSQALTPFPTLERLLRPVLGDAIAFLERWVGGIASVRRRLEQLGRAGTVEQFRAEQVLWGGGGLAVALVLSLLLAARHVRRTAFGRLRSARPLRHAFILLLVAAVCWHACHHDPARACGGP